eukprot:RCo042907
MEDIFSTPPISTGRTRSGLLRDRRELLVKQLVEKDVSPPKRALRLWSPVASAEPVAFPWAELSGGVLPAHPKGIPAARPRPHHGLDEQQGLPAVKPEPIARWYGRRFHLECSMNRPKTMADSEAESERMPHINLSTDWNPMYSSFTRDNLFHPPPLRALRSPTKAKRRPNNP